MVVQDALRPAHLLLLSPVSQILTSILFLRTASDQLDIDLYLFPQTTDNAIDVTPSAAAMTAVTGGSVIDRRKNCQVGVSAV